MMTMKQKIESYILLLSAVLALAACSEDDMLSGSAQPTPAQQALIGRAVNFDASMAEEFDTRVSYNSNGTFNEGDLMWIYRQYWKEDYSGWEALQSYRTYHYDYKYVSGTNISLGREWKVEPDRLMSDNWNPVTGAGTTRPQTEADSLTWENGRTVRFRAWSRSNYSNSINSGTAGNYYPDYLVADWVTVSGPTLGIPLSLRHVCNRITITNYRGNEFAGAEICLDKEDYKWADNADSYEHDQRDIRTDEQAQAAVDSVLAAYNRMCLPAGVDIETGALRAMTDSLYEQLAANKGFATLEQKTDGIVDYGVLTPDEISTDVKHPVFSQVNGLLYFMSIPYDMSNAPTKGDVLILPSCTRFRIKIRDVNNGDQANTGGYEAKEHIFALSDIKENGKPKYPDGLPLIPGKSYRFVVGYLYDSFTVTVIEEGIHWSVSNEPIEGNAVGQQVATNPDHEPYAWWKKGINEAILHTKESKDYNPVFEISSREEFLEFIALVNGTAAQKTTGLKRVLRGKDKINPDADPVLDNEDTRRYWWYDEEATALSLAQPGGDTVWVSRAEAEERGYIIYRHYFPQISDKLAYSVEECLQGPFSFYDESVNLHLVVRLTDDIDLADWELATIGLTPELATSVGKPESAFRGYFDGGTHTLSNVYMTSGYLFGNIIDAEIRDLRLTSTHPLSLLDQGSTSSQVQTLRIVGISLQADTPAGASPFGNALLGEGPSYLVGCIHEGNADKALVDTASNLRMYGCMHAATDLTGAALLGGYAPGVQRFFAPMAANTLSWGRFMCNYYQKTPFQSTYAVGGSSTDVYLPQQYIRGSRAHILRALNDNLLPDDVAYATLSAERQAEYYGLAPWHAMNYGIARYNATSTALSSEYQGKEDQHLCHMQYWVNPLGYGHQYPLLIPADGASPNNLVTADDYGNIKDILYLNN